MATSENQNSCMSSEEMMQSVQDHALLSADRAQQKLGGSLTAENYEQFLQDTDCLRCPTTIIFTTEGLETHQFAQPVFSNLEGRPVCDLRIDPRFENQPDKLYMFVAYMAAAINYGNLVSTELCEMQGAALTGMSEEEFYNTICEIADS